MANKFVSLLETVGKDVEKALAEVVTYLPVVSTLAGMIFPQAAAGLASADAAANLIQNAVLVVEQKYAASGVQNGTGAQKLADVLTITTSAVTQLLAEPQVAAALAKEGITVDTAYITNLVNAVVAIINTKGPGATATT